VRRKKAILFKQLIASFLLSVLSVVTIIQVTHTHASIANHGQEKNCIKRSILPGYNTPTAESKCFICEYQLAKDVDASFSIVAIVSPVQSPLITENNYSFTFQRIVTIVETRGPPAIV
jgi:hypothetical protein